MKISHRTRRLLEISANIAIIVVALVIVGKFIWPRNHPRQDASVPSVGSVVSLPGVDWKQNGNTLLMVLQKGCRYCEESAPFYKRLHEQRSGTQPKMVVVIPGEASETVPYLSEHGIRADEIVNRSLAEVSVAATPTLLLIDQAGQVKNVWIGKLDGNQTAGSTPSCISNSLIESHHPGVHFTRDPVFDLAFAGAALQIDYASGLGGLTVKPEP